MQYADSLYGRSVGAGVLHVVLIGWPVGVPALPPASAWAEQPNEAWREFDRLLDCLREQPWDLPEGTAFVLTTRVDGLPAVADERHWLPLRGRADWVQCVLGCGGRVWPRKLSPTHFSCPMCGGGLRPWVRLSRDSAWVQGANSGAENRFQDVVARLRGRRVELMCHAMTGEQTLQRLAQRLRRELA
mgnify:CR=1 FL=1